MNYREQRTRLEDQLEELYCKAAKQYKLTVAIGADKTQRVLLNNYRKEIDDVHFDLIMVNHIINE